MEQKEIFEKVCVILKDKLGDKASNVKMENSVLEDLKADSLDVVEIIMDVDKEFNISTPNEEVEKMKTVSDMVVAIESKLAGK